MRIIFKLSDDGKAPGCGKKEAAVLRGRTGVLESPYHSLYNCDYYGNSVCSYKIVTTPGPVSTITFFALLNACY